MRPQLRSVIMFFVVLVFAGDASGQVDEICAEFGVIPSLNSPFAHVPYVFGKISVKGIVPGAKFPKITVTLIDRDQIQRRLTVEKSGNYCFKPSGGGGTLIVEVDGIEATRRTLASMAAAQQREDFELFMNQTAVKSQPSTISAKFSRPRNEKTIELYGKAAAAETNKEMKQATGYLKEIVAVDPGDFIAWAQLGSLYFEQNSLADAEAAFRKAIELKPEYTPAWIHVGKIRVAQKQYEAAVGIFNHAAELDPTSARTFQLLGETYLLSKQGTLGAQALNEAIRLDPVGMAECHLQLAHLYQLANAKQMATKEYKLFLTKVPEHHDKKKFEKFIKDNPE